MFCCHWDIIDNAFALLKINTIFLTNLQYYFSKKIVQISDVLSKEHVPLLHKVKYHDLTQILHINTDLL